MKRTYSRQEKDLVFDLWKRGAGFSDIARVLDAQPGSIFTVLRKHGGIKPAHRKRSSTHLATAQGLLKCQFQQTIHSDFVCERLSLKHPIRIPTYRKSRLD